MFCDIMKVLLSLFSFQNLFHLFGCPSSRIMLTSEAWSSTGEPSHALGIAGAFVSSRRVEVVLYYTATVYEATNSRNGINLCV